MEEDLDAGVVQEGLKLQKELVQRLREKNKEMAEKTKRENALKKTHSSSINKKGRNVFYEHLRKHISDDTHVKCLLALNKHKLKVGQMSEPLQKDMLGWISKIPSTKSLKLKEELIKLELQLSTRQITSSRSSGSSLEGSFTKLGHGSMTWYFLGNGLKWLVASKTADEDFDLEEGAMEVYRQYTAHIQLEGKFLFLDFIFVVFGF
jgi:hypothetical protein